MQRKNIFIVVCAGCLFALRVNAQTIKYSFGKSIPEKLVFAQTKIGDADIIASAPGSFSNIFLLQSAAPAKNKTADMLHGDFYATHLGIICKKEWQFEKTTHIPFRFRLGSLDYCNMLEGKNNPR